MTTARRPRLLPLCGLILPLAGAEPAPPSPRRRPAGGRSPSLRRDLPGQGLSDALQPDLRPGHAGALLHHRAALRRAGPVRQPLQSRPGPGRVLDGLSGRVAHHVPPPPRRALPQRPRAHGRRRQVLARTARPARGRATIPISISSARSSAPTSTGRARPPRSRDSG
ncbi:MAG: hypothetical protein MZV63_63180 [Marinilabiliales bacterium]|nr:hypothetical protein [Marinilabiliales bacterium]